MWQLYTILYVMGLFVCGVSIGALTIPPYGFIVIGGGLIIFSVGGFLYTTLKK